MDYLKSKDIRTFPHPAKSPDMSPIEHIWPALKEGIWQEKLNLKLNGEKLTKEKIWEKTQ